MSLLLVDTPTGIQALLNVHVSGGYFDPARVVWDDRADGALPTITLGGMVRAAGPVLNYSQARMNIHLAALAAVATVSAKQFQRALESLGYLSTAQTAIDAGTTAQQIEWNSLDTVRRDSTLLATLLGGVLTSPQLDAVFTAAKGF